MFWKRSKEEPPGAEESPADESSPEGAPEEDATREPSDVPESPAAGETSGPDAPQAAREPQEAPEPVAAPEAVASDEVLSESSVDVDAGEEPDEDLEPELEADLQAWPERKPLGPFDQDEAATPEQASAARAQAAADLQAVIQESGQGVAGKPPLPVMPARAQSQPDPELRIREIGMQLYEATVERGPAKAAASYVSGRAMQRRILAQAMADPVFKTQLFRFVDVYPSIRDSGDLLRHLRSYLGDVDAPRPLDLLVATDKRRLPSWAVTRLTERGMQRMAETLIAGRDATDALPALKRLRRRHTGFTLDILGEACLSDAEADEYARRYHDLLDYLPPRVARWADDPLIDHSPYGADPRVNVSLKVSSLYSQIDPLDFDGSRQALVSALKPLFLKAQESNVFLTLDIERFVHRDLTYAAFADLCRDPELRDYPHLGIVVQAYLRDSAEIVQGLLYLARSRGTPFTVRLVKGAYWDYETILAAQEHWPPPVFLRKAETDAQFERLAKKLIDNWQWTRPALGTHNIRSIAVGIAAAEAAGLPPTAVEIQVLHGMADSIRRAAVKQGYRVREYVPVGELIPGMAYLVRRLLENTANESFLRQTFAQHEDVEMLLAPPGLKLAAETAAARLAAEPVPPGAIEGAAAVVVTGAEPAAAGAPRGGAGEAAQAERTEAPVCKPFQNEPHADFSREENRKAMEKALATIAASAGRDYPLLIDGSPVQTGEWITSVNPARPSQAIGRVATAGRAEADRALDSAVGAFHFWRDTPAIERADILFKAAEAMRAQRFELAALEVMEAGKPWREADADVCEAIDFLEYYGREMLRLSEVWQLSDVPGESDLYFYEPRGVAVVVAPWNFPLAIPTGMVSAALAAGNSVVFKPATPTPILGYAMVRILHEAGVPGGALSFLPGPGGEVGDYLVADPRVDLVAFTGSLDVGLSIMGQATGAKPGQSNIKRVITEMGGKNAIVIDTDADLDAAVEGVLVSAFNYAGQKCSACSRVVVLDTIYDQFLRRLTQATASLKSGDPADPGTRVGPVISADARDRIFGYIEKGKREAMLAEPEPGSEGDVTAHRPAPPASAPEAPAPAAGAAASALATPEASQAAALPEEPADEAPPSAPEAANAEAASGDEQPESEQHETHQQLPLAIEGFYLNADRPAPLTGEPVIVEEPGYFVPPHIFADVPPDSTIAQEEIFGPVLSVMRARNFDEALDLALGVRYGLTGGLYSRNPAHIMRAAREFRVGNLYINRPITGAMVGRQPFGGSRMSGVGSKAGGPDYLLQFMEPRVVTENTIRRGFAPDVPPAATPGT
jgi:RHH-type transcriptional regulator, proline utilization regulon repressor / proline dehydrogenase / delta 1-pyrroline-5-carboxylate dehydrogenase